MNENPGHAWPESRSFWRDKCALVTGGSGFLGSSVVRALRKRGAADIVIPRRADHDLRDLSAIQHLLAGIRARWSPEHVVVIHLAARVGGIGANRAHPAQFFYDNLLMSVMLLDEARKIGIGKFVAIGTVCAYPKMTPVPFREDDLWNGYPEETNAPYGLAKKMLLVQSQAYREEYGFNSIYLLPVNLYGPGDDFDVNTSHVIPALIRKCVEARDGRQHHLVVWGSGRATREFLYVDDAAEAILLAAERFNGPEPVNIGSGTETSIETLVGLIAGLTGFEGSVAWDTSKPDGQPRRCLDTSRAERLFGFRARTPFGEGLRRTIAWYESRGADEAAAARA